MIYKAAYFKTFFDYMVLPYIASDGITVTTGKWYLINTKFGEDIGLALSTIKDVPQEQFLVKKPVVEPASDANIDDIEIENLENEEILEPKEEHIQIEMDVQQIENFKILREITPEELKEWQAFREEEKKAFEIAKKEIENLKLEMKLINVHFLFQKKKVIFNFTADNRIDFRQLVKKLASVFKTRIEMRQIGVRDAAKILGGFGVCGNVNCCLRSNCHIVPIYLKMAKEQGFVVNSSKLTGACGRLMCCLSYEAQLYTEEKKNYPEIGSVVTDGQKNYTVSALNLIKKEVYVMDENHHQKKFPVESLTFINKESSGVSCYRVQYQNSEVNQVTENINP